MNTVDIRIPDSHDNTIRPSRTVHPQDNPVESTSVRQEDEVRTSGWTRLMAAQRNTVDEQQQPRPDRIRQFTALVNTPVDYSDSRIDTIFERMVS